MAIFLDRRSRELTRFESILALVVILLIIYLLLGRLDAVFATVEKARLSTSLAQMNSALDLAAAAGLIRGDQSLIAALQGANPMALDQALEQPTDTSSSNPGADSGGDSARYVGAFASPDPATMPAGKWYFDTDQRYLIYRIEAEDFFETSLPGVKRARFRVHLDFVDKNGNQMFDANEDRFQAVSLVTVENYRWIR